MKRVSTLGLIALALSTAAPPSSAQPALDARLGVGLDALAPAGFDSERRAVFEGSFGPGVRFASEHGRIGYELEGGRFNGPGDWSFLNHAIEGSYRVDLGSRQALRLFAGGAASWRRNGDAWSEADYDALGGFANLEWRPRSGLTVRTGYRLADRSFAQITELDQLEQDAFASAHATLPSRTTLIVESHFGWKSYEGLAAEMTPLSPSPVAAASGAGRGRGGEGLRAALPSLVPVPGTGLQAQQWNVLAHVAQGLAERTGVWARCFVRRTGGEVPPAVVSTPAGFFDDGVYDDPFASDLTAVSGGLKHLFASGIGLRVGGSWQWKDFTAIPALGVDGSTLPGDPLRNDRIQQVGASASLPVGDVHAFSIALEMGYAFTRSISNDVFHDYRDQAIGLTVSVHR